MLTTELNKLTLNGFNGNIFNFSLVDLIKLAGIKNVTNKKTEIVRLLNKYLINEENIMEIWNSLSPFDKEFIQDIIINKGYLNQENLERLAGKYKKTKVKVTYYDQYNTKSGYFNRDSKVALFFIGGDIPANILSILKRLLPQPEYRWMKEKVNPEDLEGLSLFENEEELSIDMINLTKLIGTGKLKTTKANNELTKASIKKMNEELNYGEYQTQYYNMNTIKKGQDSIRMYGLYQMFMNSDVIDIDNNTLTLGQNANAFLSESFTEKMKRLYQAYVGSPYIQEGERIKERKFDLGHMTRMDKMRENFGKEIAKLPIGEWIDVEALSEDFFKYDRLFLREYIERVGVIPRSNSYPILYEHKWEELERRVIDVMLLEYLHPLGIVDIGVEDDEVEKAFDWGDTTEILVVKYLKLTPLGAYILGSNPSYQDPTLKGQVMNALWVTEEMEIMVPKSVKKYQHEIFFDRIATRLEQDEMSVYPINFQMALKAYEQGIKLDKILDYLKNECTKTIPPLLKQIFEQWERDKQKIRIRQVTVIECENIELTKELVELNGVNKYRIKTLEPTIEIETDAAVKVKKELEKQNYFCEIE